MSSVYPPKVKFDRYLLLRNLQSGDGSTRTQSVARARRFFNRKKLKARKSSVRIDAVMLQGNRNTTRKAGERKGLAEGPATPCTLDARRKNFLKSMFNDSLLP
ncbi:macrodomain Ter protein organizer (MatP/YcbG family) [Cupriavidus metallidurans]|jgi:hypothetical protein|uniref:Uncharacterized protein n=1 Tax=Cupriavidus metallidurans (strain ATCC 43123 / DSM 2839 / NBRC 102507 / CH34) TaxID=266264 RepID=Q1LCC5_CUPMC|nr:hypothetical protein [Cupriavidus metallidurans]ABF12201.1 hypothetical protein Rmet_5342 [Cupriavidus metallidurans CH34]QGS32549.1 hypothetical protein FOB83_27375 [Cupriavidus metallidurans]